MLNEQFKLEGTCKIQNGSISKVETKIWKFEGQFDLEFQVQDKKFQNQNGSISKVITKILEV